MPHDDPRNGSSRRRFMQTACLGIAGATVSRSASAAERDRAAGEAWPIAELRMHELRVPRIYTTRVATAGSQDDGKEASLYWIIELVSDDGTIGVGEVADVEPVWRAPTLAEVGAALSGLLIGRDVRMRRRLSDEVAWALPTLWHQEMRRMVATAVDMALIDLAGKRLSVPAHELLGGAYRRSLPISWVAFIRDTAALEQEIREKVDQGFTAFKLKVGDDFDADCEHVRTIRRVAGTRAYVKIDASGSWQEAEAIDKIRRFHALGVDAVETPVADCSRLVAKNEPQRVDEHAERVADVLARVRAAVPCEIIEHVVDFDDRFALALAARHAVDVFNICPSQAGSLERAMRLAAIAQAAGIRVLLGSTVELGPATAASLAVGLAAKAASDPCDLVGPGLLADDVIKPRFAYREGTLAAREAPGLGIELDQEKLRELAAKPQERSR